MLQQPSWISVQRIQYKMNCELMLTYDTLTYMFNVYKIQLSRQTGSRNRRVHNMAYLYEACDQISNFCHQQLLSKISWTDGKTDRWKDRGKTVYPPGRIIIFIRATLWFLRRRNISLSKMMINPRAVMLDFHMDKNHKKKLRSVPCTLSCLHIVEIQASHFYLFLRFIQVNFIL